MRDFIYDIVSTIFIGVAVIMAYYIGVDSVNSAELPCPRDINMEVYSVHGTDIFYIEPQEEGYSISCETEGHIKTFEHLQEALDAAQILQHTEEEDYRKQTYLDIIEGRYQINK